MEISTDRAKQLLGIFVVRRSAEMSTGFPVPPEIKGG
jgi:hypothetical protein